MTHVPLATLERWIAILINAGEFALAAQLRREISRKEAA